MSCDSACDCVGGCGSVGAVSLYDSSVFITPMARGVFEQLSKIVREEHSKIAALENKSTSISDVIAISSHRISSVFEMYRVSAEIEREFREMNANVTALVNSMS